MMSAFTLVGGSSPTNVVDLELIEPIFVRRRESFFVGRWIFAIEQVNHQRLAVRHGIAACQSSA
jgi:hypothetical protein